ncbi:MAG: malate:quinone oxidoreductase [Synechococcus sp. ChBW.bin.23]
MDRYDVVLVGAGVMSATLATLLHELDPELRLLVVERLEAPALESSAAGNNAGTGHAANCELNYTPLLADGTVSTVKPLAINSSFECSLEFWSSLCERGCLDPSWFIHRVPHISFVWGEGDVAYLRQRYEQMKELPAFAAMEWSCDKGELASWIPLVMAGRDPQMAVAATRIERGTDVDFGALSRSLFVPLQATGALDLVFGTSVSNLNRCAEGWELQLRCPSRRRVVTTPFVFLGAGGGALPLLQRSRIPEAADYAGFPVSGQWLVCNDPDLSEHHYAKVYGKAKVGAPPMSVPHLDSRWIDGRRSLLFGPYAGFSSKFLKQGSLLDLPRSVRSSNVLPMLQVGVNNIPLVRYLVNQLRQSDEDRMEALKAFLPTARADDWTLSVAGQRVQIIKRTPAGGRLQLGTEVVSAADGSLAALLGASPGASTSVTIMLEILKRCFPDRLASQAWQQRLQALLPSYGQDLNADGDLLQRSRDRSDALLGLQIAR